jgi:hypothetical protein
MQFLYPIFLWSLLALAIPVLIHLFYFRRFKKVAFTNVRFLKELKEETSHRSRVRNLLVLAARMIALAALILAFAFPFIPSPNQSSQGQRASTIFIDNSFSMQGKTEDVTLLEQARERARDVINSHSDADLIHLLTHDFKGKHQRWLTKEEALNLLDEINISSSSRKISEIIDRQEQMLTKVEDYLPHIYWLTDLQADMIDIPVFPDTSLALTVVPFESQKESNVALDSVWMAGPVATSNEPTTFLARITNYGNGLVENVRLSVQHGGQTQPLAVVDIPSKESVVDTFTLSLRNTGWQSALVKLTDYPITFDDQYHISFEIPDELDVLVVSENATNPSLQKAVGSLPQTKLTTATANKLNYNNIPSQDLVILDGLRLISTGMISALVDYVDNGGNLLVFPGANSDITSLNQLLTNINGPIAGEWKKEDMEVTRIDQNEFVFNSVFFKISKNVRLPKTSQYLDLKRSGKGMEQLLTLRNGQPFLAKSILGDGRAFICASPLGQQYSDLTQRADIFIPMIYKMALSKTKTLPLSYVIGKENIISVKNIDLGNEGVLEMKGPSNFIPGMVRTGKKVMLDLEGQVSTSGIYDLYSGDDLIRKIAFNYNRLESNMNFEDVDSWLDDFHPQAELVDYIQQADLASFIREQRDGKVLWRLFLVISLIFLAVEQLLLRFWKT